MANERLQKAIDNYMKDNINAMYCFVLAKNYDDLGHYASALSYYLKAAENSSDDILSYEALLRIFLCFKKQGSNNVAQEGIIHRALSLMPLRPEAYFLISRMYEEQRKWFEAYSFATMGETLCNGSYQPLQTDVDYPGFYGFLFEKAVSSWWIGLYEQSFDIFTLLDNEYVMRDIHIVSVKSNLEFLKKALNK